MRSVRNDTQDVVVISYHTDPDHFENPDDEPCHHELTVIELAPGETFTYDETEGNGLQITAVIGILTELT